MRTMKNLGVIFDMDGVLVDSYAPHLESWRQLASELGETITEEQFAATFGRTSRDIIRQLFGITDDLAVKKMDDRKEAVYRNIIRDHIPAMPGAIELVKSLYAAGWKIAVGSSGPPENVKLVCDGMGWTSMLSGIVTGADVTRGKPDPQVFLLAAERLGLAAQCCVVIEDAPAGVEAAHRAGMPCVGLLGSHNPTALAAAELIVPQLAELSPDRLMKLFTL